MQKSIIERINDAVSNAKRYPESAQPKIEYSFELPEVDGITPDSFFGVKAVFNKEMKNQSGYQVTYKL